MRSSPVMKSARKTGPCSRRSSPPASSTTSTRPPTSPKHSRRSSTAIPIAASKTSCRGDSAKRQASLNRVAAKRLHSNKHETLTTGLEDLVLKRRHRPHHTRRLKHWIKVKNGKRPAIDWVMEAFG